MHQKDQSQELWSFWLTFKLIISERCISFNISFLMFLPIFIVFNFNGFVNRFIEIFGNYTFLSLNQNSVPIPTVLFIPKSTSCSSSIFFTIDNPIPVPSFFLVLSLLER